MSDIVGVHSSLSTSYHLMRDAGLASLPLHPCGRCEPPVVLLDGRSCEHHPAVINTACQNAIESLRALGRHALRKSTVKQDRGVWTLRCENPMLLSAVPIGSALRSSLRILSMPPRPSCEAYHERASWVYVRWIAGNESAFAVDSHHIPDPVP